MTPSFMKNKDAIFYFLRKEEDTLLWRNWKNDIVRECLLTGVCQILTTIAKKKRYIGVKTFDDAIDFIVNKRRQEKRIVAEDDE
jgi:hypothetical protein